MSYEVVSQSIEAVFSRYRPTRRRAAATLTASSLHLQPFDYATAHATFERASSALGNVLASTFQAAPLACARAMIAALVAAGVASADELAFDWDGTAETFLGQIDPLAHLGLASVLGSPEHRTSSVDARRKALRRALDARSPESPPLDFASASPSLTLPRAIHMLILPIPMSRVVLGAPFDVVSAETLLAEVQTTRHDLGLIEPDGRRTIAQVPYDDAPHLHRVDYNLDLLSSACVEAKRLRCVSVVSF